ncbi:MAG: aromatic amino acid lyase [Armatimonadetes bacterium]|nr:aromatic amino acid lyase [Armatimonadota bacterium]
MRDEPQPGLLRRPALELVEALLELLNRDDLPRVPSQGSIGALTHMAHVGLALGIRLAEGEGLSLLSGTSRSSASSAWRCSTPCGCWNGPTPRRP